MALPLPDRIVTGKATIESHGDRLFIEALPGTQLEWDTLTVEGNEGLDIFLQNPSDELTLLSENPIQIEGSVKCHGHLVIQCKSNLTFEKSGHFIGRGLRAQTSEITHKGSIDATDIILEAKKIILDEGSLLNASGPLSGGTIFVGGGWRGEDKSIANAEEVEVRKGSMISADALRNGSGGTIVLWSTRSTLFDGKISAIGSGAGKGGQVEVSSHQFLSFQGNVELASPGGNGLLLLDPLSITVNATGPADINGNGGGLDISFITQLDNATTTPTGFPNANSIITSGALQSLLTNNVSMILAAQTFITFNGPVTAPGTNVTLTLEAPTVNLNAPIQLLGTLAGVGVSTVNVGAAGVIQNGVAVASSGTTVNVAAGTFSLPADTVYNTTGVEIINKNITLNGSGQNNTTLICNGGLPTHLSRNPLIYAQNGSAVTVQNLKVDGNFWGFGHVPPPANADITGILFNNTSGTISHVFVTRIGNNPPPAMGGGQIGNGIRIQDNLGGNVTIDSCTVNLFQKAGIVVDSGYGTGVTATITNNTVTGFGSPIDLSSNGIQLSRNAKGVISNNSVTGLQFTDHASSSGILLFDSGPNVTISNNTSSNNDGGIVNSINVGGGAGAIVQNNIVANNGDVGILMLTGPATISSNTLTNNGTLSAVGQTKSNLVIFSSTAQTFQVNNNTLTTASGTSAAIIQGQALNLAPDAFFQNNTFIDPPGGNQNGPISASHVDFSKRVPEELVP